jgi:general secretion pathway protein C
MLINLFKRHFLWIALFLSGLVGLALGNLTSTVIGSLYEPTQATIYAPVKVTPKPPQRDSLANYQTIINHNIFNSSMRNRTENVPSISHTATRSTTKWQLVGTLSGGDRPLATLKDSTGTTTYQLDEELPDGATLSTVERNRVELRYPEGRIQVLEVIKDVKKDRASSRSKTTRSKKFDQRIDSLGDNRWLIPALVAEDARANIGELLKQVQASPYLEGDQTTGFQIRRLKSGSLIARIGLKRGDILRKINGLELNSPEKALQIFAQLRQSKQISIDLERRGKAMTFAYEIR